jgi:hypothetical protein
MGLVDQEDVQISVDTHSAGSIPAGVGFETFEETVFMLFTETAQ